MSGLTGPTLAPPSILLDYMHGAAVFKHWTANDMKPMLNERHESNIPALPGPVLPLQYSAPMEVTSNWTTQLTLILCLRGLDVATGPAISLNSQSCLELWTLGQPWHITSPIEIYSLSVRAWQLLLDAHARSHECFLVSCRLPEGIG